MLLGVPESQERKLTHRKFFGWVILVGLPFRQFRGVVAMGLLETVRAKIDSCSIYKDVSSTGCFVMAILRDRFRHDAAPLVGQTGATFSAALPGQLVLSSDSERLYEWSLQGSNL